MKKTNLLHIRISNSEKNLLNDMATRSNLNASEFIRRKVFQERQIR